MAIFLQKYIQAKGGSVGEILLKTNFCRGTLWQKYDNDTCISTRFSGFVKFPADLTNQSGGRPG
jgi:hypothetical protein